MELIIWKRRGVFINSWESFDKYAEEYDAWYEKYKPAYESELFALKTFLPENPEKLKSLEIGVGTGRFASALGIGLGLEPSRPMERIAKKRGIETVLGVAEFLPFKNQQFDLILIVTALAFLKNPIQALWEALRALKPGGQIVAGILDRDSPQGTLHRIRKQKRQVLFGCAFSFSSGGIKIPGRNWVRKD